MVRYCACLFACLSVFAFANEVHADFDLSITIDGSLTMEQRSNLENAIETAESLWEGFLTGYQAGISISRVDITVEPNVATALADAQVTDSTRQGGYLLATAGLVRINPAAINFWASWDGTGPTPPNTEFVGVNFLDDIIFHEIGHALGFGDLWEANNVYSTGSGEYTGEHGLAAFVAEFDTGATFVPVELAGGGGRVNVHWDQIVRSSSEEGNPTNPWPLDPRLGITDAQGRDFAFDIMTSTFDPDYGEPFISQTTIQSFRDLGFVVVPEPTAAALLVVGTWWMLLRGSMRGSRGDRATSCRSPKALRA